MIYLAAVVSLIELLRELSLPVRSPTPPTLPSQHPPITLPNRETKSGE
jgi:hypothetical protein